jgi:hypothetical protein
MLCNIIFKMITNFIIYIEISMNIFIVYIGIIGPLSRFRYTNFKASLIIKIINFNGIFKMAHVAMCVIFHVNVIICQIFNLSHIYCIFVEKPHLLDENFQINHMVSKHGSNYVKIHDSIYF